MEVVDANTLFKFDIKDTDKRKPGNPQDTLFNVPKQKQEKIVQIFGENLDAGNLGYINNLIKSREAEDEALARKQRRHLRNKSDISEITRNQGHYSVSPRPSEQGLSRENPRTPNLRKGEIEGEIAHNLEKRTNSVDENSLHKPNTRFLRANPSNEELSSLKEVESREASGQKERLFGEFLKKNGMANATPTQLNQMTFQPTALQTKLLPAEGICMTQDICLRFILSHRRYW